MTVEAAFRIGGVNYQSTDFNMTPAFKANQAVVANNPATSSAWTFSAADGAEIGVKLIARVRSTDCTRDADRGRQPESVC